MRLCLVVATADNRVIGRDNQMPWHLPCDLKYFKRVTMAKPILMGRKTFDSIGRPLPGRTNIIVTRQSAWCAEGVQIAHSLDAAVKLASLSLIGDNEEVMVIGGAQIYREALAQAHRIYLTQIHAQFEGDTYFPEINHAEWKEVGREDHRADPRNPFDHSYVVLDRVAS